MEPYFRATADAPCATSDDCGAMAHCNLHAGECMGLPVRAAHGPCPEHPSLFNQSRFLDPPESWKRTLHRSAAFSTEGRFTCNSIADQIASFRSSTAAWLQRSEPLRSLGAMPSEMLDARRGIHSWHQRRHEDCFGCGRERGALDNDCCSGRGACIFGICVCRNGAFGMDCAHQRADGSAGPESPRPLPRGLAIYVYELPPEMNLAPMGAMPGEDTLFTAELRFTDTLLRDFTVRTLDPEKADLFLVPLLSYFNAGANTVCHRGQAELALSYVRSRYPFWERSGGSDHVFWAPNDMGACGMGQLSVNPIIITHFGLLGDVTLMNACSGAASRFFSAKKLVSDMSSGWWCFAPHKDVVVPPVVGAREPDAPDPERPSEVKLMHAGGIWGWGNSGLHRVTSYSQGMRQGLYLHYEAWRNNSGGARVPSGTELCRVSPKCAADFRTESPWQDAAEKIEQAELDRLLRVIGSKHANSSDASLCYSASGKGFGDRTTRFALDGCVPLIAQPFNVQPFEHVLPYDSFSERLDFEALPKLPTMLRNLTREKVVRMRRALHRYRRAFEWQDTRGADAGATKGLAYNFTILQLCQRAMLLRGSLKSGPGASCAELAGALRETLHGHASSSSPTSDGDVAMGGRAPFDSEGMPTWYPEALVQAVRTLQVRRREAVAWGCTRSRPRASNVSQHSRASTAQAAFVK